MNNMSFVVTMQRSLKKIVRLVDDNEHAAMILRFLN